MGYGCGTRQGSFRRRLGAVCSNAVGCGSLPLRRWENCLKRRLTGRGRVHVLPDLSIPGHSEVFVIGDLASMTDANGRLLPGVAPVAMQQGVAASKNVLRLVQGQATEPFHYFDKGSLATIGRAAAVADFGKLQLSGFFAWMAWLLIHILFLIGFRNRLIVMIQWAVVVYHVRAGWRD